MRRDQPKTPEPMRSTLANTDQPRISHSGYHHTCSAIYNNRRHIFLVAINFGCTCREIKQPFFAHLISGPPPPPLFPAQLALDGQPCYFLKLHYTPSSCEIQDFVETHFCKLCVILRSRVYTVCVCHIGLRLLLQLQSV